MSHIFISYVREDFKRVDRLKQSLIAAGLVAWVDRDDMKVGQNWHLVVPDVLQSARFFIACFSKNVENGEGEMNFPPDYPKMPGEPPRVQPSRKNALNWGNTD